MLWQVDSLRYFHDLVDGLRQGGIKLGWPVNNRPRKFERSEIGSPRRTLIRNVEWRIFPKRVSLGVNRRGEIWEQRQKKGSWQFSVRTFSASGLCQVVYCRPTGWNGVMALIGWPIPL